MVQESALLFLETDIEAMNKYLPMLKEFILPAGSLSCSYAHQARAVCRRAERSLISLQKRDQNIQKTSLLLLNRCLTGYLWHLAACNLKNTAKKCTGKDKNNSIFSVE